jgi:hypothetical protein
VPERFAVQIAPPVARLTSPHGVRQPAR